MNWRELHLALPHLSEERLGKYGRRAEAAEDEAFLAAVKASGG